MRESVRERYTEAARSVREKGTRVGAVIRHAVGGGSEAGRATLPAGSYSAEEPTELPEEAVGACLPWVRESDGSGDPLCR